MRSFIYDVYAVLMEIAVVAEAEQIQLERLCSPTTALAGHIGDIDSSKVRLAGHRAQAGELRAVELDKIVIVRMLVRESLQHFGRIVRGILVLLAAQQSDAVQFFFLFLPVMVAFSLHLIRP